MGDGQAEAGLDPEGAPTPGPRAPAEASALLLAVERVGADVAALARLLAGQPEEVAARLDIDTATAAITVQVGALDSGLDQLRLSLLAGLDRVGARLDRPPWLAELRPAHDEVTLARARDEQLSQGLAELASAVERAVVDRPVPDSLDAVNRLGAALRDDIAGLTRIVAAQPQEVAAVIDLAAATEPLAARLGTLGTTLDHLRVALLTAIDRTADHLDQPTWLPALHAAVADRPSTSPEELGRAVAAVGERIEEALATSTGLRDVLDAVTALAADRRLDQLTALVSDRRDDPRLDHLAGAVNRLADEGPRIDQLATTVTRAVGERIDQVTAAMATLADGVKAGAAVADALELVGRRLEAVEATSGQMVTESRQWAEREAPLSDRLGAIAAQVDRITPLARAGDEAGSLLGMLERVSAGLDEVAAQQRSGMVLGRAGASADGDVDSRLEDLVDGLAGVARRQDEVTTAVASVLDQVRVPMSVEAVLDRMEQRERSLAARLDRIDAALRQRPAGPAPSSAS
ncbi:MAG: hypothetical protein ABIS47_04325, partial [Acidimicrobiales bacterium]